VLYRLWHPPATLAADGLDSNWDAAAHHARDAGEPTLVLFTADWCPACRGLHDNVLSRSDVRAEIRSHYNFLTVDLTAPTPAAATHSQKCGVRFIPLLIRFDANGKETDRTNGLGPADLIEWLKRGE
jgi:thiol:disulfide interchange protein DsbD